MSLNEKWEEYKNQTWHEPHDGVDLYAIKIAQRAFYVGAEAALPIAAYNADLAVEIQAEIDRFKGLK